MTSGCSLSMVAASAACRCFRSEAAHRHHRPESPPKPCDYSNTHEKAPPKPRVIALFKDI
ncbi:uncharacterized protein K441DRAFT_670275 [Cenococcum geophilum 1.58]|uniref:Uncharacterized protein n=1 Tax=Cenococcum geophilum 1.58 TaxID=794803 RepID=A0ACC8ENK4_9PEZI|nr:hypothetical protein K441DRAFT_670275 [Cenococcum geophilum 1.58]